MRLVPLLAVLALNASLPAQTTVPAGNVVLLQATGQGCPVGLEARHGQEGNVVSVSPSSKRPEQSYRLTFVPGEGRAIAQAKVTLHGLAGGQVLPAGETGKAGASESFNLNPAPGAKHMFHSTVYTEKLTGVQWIELNQLTYADGTTWHASASSTCRVAPNGFMLVAADAK